MRRCSGELACAFHSRTRGPEPSRTLESEPQEHIMRNRLIGSTLAVVALLVFSFFILAQTSQQPGVARARVPPSTADLTGVWRRSRRPPDNARRYTIFELAMSITSA